MTAIHAVDGASADVSSDDDEPDAALAAVLGAPLPDLSTGNGDPGHSLVLAPFLRPHTHGLHPYLVECDLPTGVDPLALLPRGSRVLRLHRRPGAVELLAVSAGCLVVVRSWRRSADIWVSGAQRERVEAISADLRARAPEPPDGKAVRVTFWQRAARGSWMRSRDLDVPEWSDVQRLYPAGVRAALSELVAYRPQAGAVGGRLLLWHGPPGTGKTTAVRAVFDAWRDWTTAHVVSDPEHLLNDADYLARVMLDAEDDDEEAGDSRRWRLIVIEDAEDLLRRDARAQVGAALGRLLNLSDGLLGQGTRALLLLTTNERIGEMHPALLRPGRCLARVEFPAFEPAEAAALLGRPVARPMTLAELLEQEGALTRLQAVAPVLQPGNYL